MIFRKRPYDYSGFSLRRLGEPRFRHVRLLGGWIVYFLLYFLTENLIPAERCHPVHCFLDDLIPFSEWFLFFYAGWFLLVAGSLAFYLFYDPPRFSKLQTFIMVTQAVAMLVYVVWPSRQDLRPDAFARDNLLTRAMAFIYAFDTSTGVCPSLHAAYSFGILSVTSKDRDLPLALRIGIGVFVFMVCLSVCFVKQHSALDVLAAVPVALLAEWFVFHRKGAAGAGCGSGRPRGGD